MSKTSVTAYTSSSVSISETKSRPAHRTRAAIVGILLLLAYSMLAYDFTGNTLLGSVFDIVSGLSVIGIASLLFPLFRPDRSGAANRSTGNTVLNVTYLICKIVEGTLMVIAGIFLLQPSTVDYRNMTYNNFHIYFFVAGALLLYLMLYRTRLVPRFISVWGLIGSTILLAVQILNLAGINHPLFQILALPIIANEVFLAIWLMVRGFSKSES